MTLWVHAQNKGIGQICSFYCIKVAGLLKTYYWIGCSSGIGQEYTCDNIQHFGKVLPLSSVASKLISLDICTSKTSLLLVTGMYHAGDQNCNTYRCNIFWWRCSTLQHVCLLLQACSWFFWQHVCTHTRTKCVISPSLQAKCVSLGVMFLMPFAWNVK